MSGLRCSFVAICLISAFANVAHSGVFDDFKRDLQKVIEKISPSSEPPAGESSEPPAGESSEPPADDGESTQTNEVDWSRLLGTWEGVASRPEAGIYDVDITIDSSREGQNCGSIDYTSLDCGGTLICKGTAGEFATFEERLTYGQTRCIDGGVVFVRESNTVLKYLWRRTVSGAIEASGSLARPQVSVPIVEAPPSPPEPIVTSQTTMEVQRLLSELGYGPGPIDGLYGEKTRAAIKAYQRDAEFTVDGAVSDALLRSLRQAKTKAKVATESEVRETVPEREADVGLEAETEAETDAGLMSKKVLPEPLISAQAETAETVETEKTAVIEENQQTEFCRMIDATMAAYKAAEQDTDRARGGITIDQIDENRNDQLRRILENEEQAVNWIGRVAGVTGTESITVHLHLPCNVELSHSVQPYKQTEIDRKIGQVALGLDIGDKVIFSGTFERYINGIYKIFYPIVRNDTSYWINYKIHLDKFERFQ